MADFGLARAFGIPVRCYSAEVSWGCGVCDMGWGEGIPSEQSTFIPFSRTQNIILPHPLPLAEPLLPPPQSSQQGVAVGGVFSRWSRCGTAHRMSSLGPSCTPHPSTCGQPAAFSQVTRWGSAEPRPLPVTWTDRVRSVSSGEGSEALGDGARRHRGHHGKEGFFACLLLSHLLFSQSWPMRGGRFSLAMT